MTSTVCDPATAAAIEQIAAGLDALSAAGMEVAGARDGSDLVREFEVLGRRLRAAQLAAMAAVDERGLHRHDGHASAKVHARHTARLSDAEASRRAAAQRALAELPLVAAAFAAGRIGVCHLDRIARAYANPRVRDRLVRNDDALVGLGATLSYRRFDALLSDWVRLADEDGAADRSQRSWERRTASMVGDLEGWTLHAEFGSLQGAELAEIYRHFVDAEFQADWAEANRLHGGAASVEHLRRTDAQRRADALARIFHQAAAARADLPGGSVVTTNIVIDHVTFERWLQRFGDGGRSEERDGGSAPPSTGTDACDRSSVGPAPTCRSGSASAPTASDEVVLGDETFRCSTVDGIPVEACEVVAESLVGHVRRVVVGADGVVIDLGRRSRLFTGGARLAAQLAEDHCYWPGCWVPTSRCQVDHLQPWSDRGGGGETNPANGAPACRRHNRLRNRGFTAHRDELGHWHVHHPDGREVR